MSSTYEFDTNRLEGSGIYVIGFAGEVIPTHNLVYLTAAGTWMLADADLAATMPVIGLSMSPAILGGRFDILLKGFIGLTTWAWATTGGEIYATSVPGIISQTPPVAPALTQIVGVATAATFIYFDPTINALGGATIVGLIGDYTYMVVRAGANYTVYDNRGGVVQGPGADADVAINWALTTGGAGCVVYLKENTTFAIDDPIIFTANAQVVRGGGRSTFIDGDALATTEHAFHLTGFDDCQIRNLSIQTQDGGTKTCHCIFIEDGADRFLVDGVVVVDSDSDGIHIEGTTITGGIVRGCDILDTDNYGIQVDMDAGHYADYIIIDQNKVTGGGNSNIAFSASSGNRYCEITNNVSYSCGGAEGIYVVSFNHGVISDNISHSNTTDGIQIGSTSTDNVVEDNVVYNNAGHGIFLEGADFNTVSGNLCEENDSGDTGNFDGIFADSASTDNVFENNYCYKNHGHGIWVEGLRNQVVGNKVQENDEDGIRITSGECQVNDNYVSDNGQDAAGTMHGILLMGSADRCIVKGNYVDGYGDVQEDGIYLSNGACHVLVEGNYCYDGMGSGIMLSANNDDCAVIGNYLFENDDYGVEIAGTCNDTRVKENHFEANVTGQILDGGVDTQTPWFFAPVSDPNHVLGRHPVVDMPVDTDTNVYAQILVPLEFQELVTCHVIVVPAAAGDLVWTVDTDYGKLCAIEDYNAHSDSDGGTDTLLIDDLACIDISGALDTPDIAGGDLVGVDFMRDGDNVADTIEESVYFMGIRVRFV